MPMNDAFLTIIPNSLYKQGVSNLGLAPLVAGVVVAEWLLFFFSITIIYYCHYAGITSYRPCTMPIRTAKTSFLN